MPARPAAARRGRATVKRVDDASNGNRVIGMRACTIRDPLASERKRSLERKGWDGEPSCKSPISRALKSHSNTRSSRGLLPEKSNVTGFFALAKRCCRTISHASASAPPNAALVFPSAQYGGTVDKGREYRAEATSDHRSACAENRK